MDMEQKLKSDYKAKLKNLEKIKGWKARADKLKSVHNKKMSEFCRDHGINEAHFNRHKNLSGTSFPTQRFIDQIEKAFLKEGV